MAGIKDIKEYEVIRQKEVPDLNSEGFLTYSTRIQWQARMT